MIFAGGLPGLVGTGVHQPPFLGRHGMAPIMGAPLRQVFPLPTGMGREMGMGVDMGMPDMGMHSHKNMGLGLGRSSFVHLPFESQRHSPLGYGDPGPPRAHSFLPQRRHRYLPFSPLGHSLYAPPRTMFDGEDDDDEYDSEDECHIPPRRVFVRQTRGGYRFASRHPSRRRGLRRGLREDSENCFGNFDNFDDYKDYEDDLGSEDEFERFHPRRSPHLRWRGWY
jgi:hypothetical protein